MFFVLDEHNNKVEALDKEGIFAVLAQAIENGSLAELVADAAFVTKLKCCVSGQTNSVAFVTQAKYNELKANGGLHTNTLYFITDDTTAESMDSQLAELTKTVGNLMDGTQVVAKASVVKGADEIVIEIGPKESSEVGAPNGRFDPTQFEKGALYVVDLGEFYPNSTGHLINIFWNRTGVGGRMRFYNGVNNIDLLLNIGEGTVALFVGGSVFNSTECTYTATFKKIGEGL